MIGEINTHSTTNIKVHQKKKNIKKSPLQNKTKHKKYT